MILAIDPGSTESAYVFLDEKLNPKSFGKIPNEEILEILWAEGGTNRIAIEMVASYGMAVGKDVFETVFWIGRFWEAAGSVDKTRIYRKEEKMNLCHSMKAKDSNITQALIDRFASGVRNKGKGTTKEKGFFYGFAADVWQAYAVGITYHDLYIKPQQ